MLYAKVAVEAANYAFDKKFDYIIPSELEETAKAGCRVTVPFGNGNKKCLGVIFEVTDFSDGSRLKKLHSVLDESPLLNEEMLSLADFIKDRTFCTYYEAAKIMLPSGINHKIVLSYAVNPQADQKEIESLGGIEKEFFDRLAEKGVFVRPESVFNSIKAKTDLSIPERLAKKGLLLVSSDAVRNLGDLTVRMIRLIPGYEDIKLTKKQKEMARVLEDTGAASVKELCYFTGLTPAVSTGLVKCGAAEFFDKQVIRLPDYSEFVSEKKTISLSDEQKKAFDGLTALAEKNSAGAALLYGVTGSGKTSVYMSVIDRVVECGKSVIVLVPEIGLTPQVLELFCRRYGKDVAVFHSALSLRERLNEWKRVKNGDAHIVIGTRSAIFAPLENIGLIIVDEEQENTYKSEQTPRYNAIDVAKFRAVKNNALLILASATPSVESFAAAMSGKYSLFTLSHRFGQAVLPRVTTVDMRSAKKANGCPEISQALFESLESNLKNGKQSILLINRRGFNTFAACNSCGEVITCPNCSISMTYHSANERLMCHYCGYSVPFSGICPECGENAVRYSGFGTQKIEDELKKLLPDARIVRMDTDSTSGKNSHEKLLDSFANGDYDIMIGTQMVAKGLNFPNVTLVGVISVDQQLNNDDFRSLEKTFSLLTQVVGRSGRGEIQGEAIVQTLTPENDIIRLAAKQDYEAFYKTEIRLRKMLIYPPFCDICVLGFSGENEAAVKAAAKHTLELIKNLTDEKYKSEKIIALAPIPARVSKVSGRYRYRLIIKCRNSKNFRKMISELLIGSANDRVYSKITVYADINPESTI